jgi:hypothetical protein
VGGTHELRNEMHMGLKWLYSAMQRTHIFSGKGFGRALPEENRNTMKAVLTPHS